MIQVSDVGNSLSVSDLLLSRMREWEKYSQYALLYHMHCWEWIESFLFAKTSIFSNSLILDKKHLRNLNHNLGHCGEKESLTAWQCVWGVWCSSTLKASFQDASNKNKPLLIANQS